MKKLLTIAALILTFVIAGFGQGAAPAAAPASKLKVGDVAPDFTLIDTNREPVKLSDFRGKKNVVLAFYVLAFTGG
jgi:cytochrome oxidase Cu insertion factor (SCO1/SenC/PrrC family)